MRSTYTATIMRILKVALVLNNHTLKAFLHSLNKISRQQSIKRNISKTDLRYSGMLCYVTSQKSEAWSLTFQRKYVIGAQIGGSLKKSEFVETMGWVYKYQSKQVTWLTRMGWAARILQLEGERDVHLHHLHLRDLWLHWMYSSAKHKLIPMQTKHHHIPTRKW